MNDFKSIKKLFKSTISSLLYSAGTNPAFNESAFPAYANKNPVIDYLFWNRVNFSYDYILKNSENVLDFGCGCGILSYALASQNVAVTAFDINLVPLNAIRDKIDFPANINYIEGSLPELEKIEDASYDSIVALDVFEHIDDLSPYVKIFKRILKPQGFIIVSGPTENWMYKIGRKIAGKVYSGSYHKTSIVDVREKFEKIAEVEKLRIIMPLVPLFEIFKVTWK